MFPVDCGEWEYTSHPNYKLLPQRCEKLRGQVVGNSPLLEEYLSNTRPAHRFQFEGLTNPGQDYLAGNYRGFAERCLVDRPVRIGRDSGTEPAKVEEEMIGFHKTLSDAIAVLMEAKNSSTPKLTDGEFVRLLSAIVAEFFALLLIIHPYANGNGHMARLCGYLICVKLHRLPKKWPIHTRPPFDKQIHLFRLGLQDELRDAVLKAIRG